MSSFKPLFNPYPHADRGDAIIPHKERLKHMAGSRCVACNNAMSLSDMLRKGNHSKVELGLCGFCAGFVLEYRVKKVSDEHEPELDFSDEYDDTPDVIRGAGFGGSFGEYSE